MKRRKRTNNSLTSSDSKLKITSKLAILVISLLVVLQIFTAIQTSSYGAVLSSLEQKELELVRENQELANSVVDTNSLISIKEKSEDLGYYTPEAMFYITEQDTVALLK